MRAVSVLVPPPPGKRDGRSVGLDSAAPLTCAPNGATACERRAGPGDPLRARLLMPRRRDRCRSPLVSRRGGGYAVRFAPPASIPAVAPRDDPLAASHTSRMRSDTGTRRRRRSQRKSAAARSGGGKPRILPAEPVLMRQVEEQGQDALRVVSRLVRQGHQALLVGGCVRDLLVGRVPKDFDVATSAHPRQVRRLFRNGRIIGRRFRLVHVRYDDRVVEVATFRREPDPDEGERDGLLILEDNEYGTAEEDARRRDFTVNGLFLDPTQRQIIDYVGGLEDLDAGLLRTIGDPHVRMAEDPVRILRAIKFATRLAFRIEDATWQAMCDTAEELRRAAPPRVLEEILRLLRSGTALGAFRKLRSCGALAAVLPALDQHLGPPTGRSEEDAERAEAFWRLLEALDSEVQRGFEPSTPALIALLFHDIVERQANPATRTLPGEARDRIHVAAEVIEPLALEARLPRRDAGKARRIILQQPRFVAPNPRRFRPKLFCRSEDFEDAFTLFRLRARARGQGWDLVQSWEERWRLSLNISEEELAEERRASRKRPRRRRRRRGH